MSFVLYTYSNIHTYIIYISAHKWSTTHSVFKFHRSKMSVIYMRSWKQCALSPQWVCGNRNRTIFFGIYYSQATPVYSIYFAIVSTTITHPYKGRIAKLWFKECIHENMSFWKIHIRSYSWQCMNFFASLFM